MKRKKRVVSIIQRMLPHYRVDFFNSLKEKAAERNIHLQVVYGNPSEKQSFKNDAAMLDWGFSIKNREIKLFSFTFYWQPCLRYVAKSDLIIVEQANKNLLNYVILFLRKISGWKVAFWGHGRNLQKEKKSAVNIFKSKFLKTSDWWFAYTESVKSFLIESGYPSSKITAVQNTLNTDNLVAYYNEIDDEDVNGLKSTLKIDSNNIGLFCGSIYPNKRIDFLVEAAKKIKERIDDFNLIIVGGGESAKLLASLIKGEEWIHYVGTKFGREKVLFYKMSKVFLMPGLVGLSIVDSFALKTPLITTDFPYHSPEIDYLVDGVNGIIAKNEVEDYVNAVVKVLSEKDCLDKLIEGCRDSSIKYTMSVMVENFLDGIEACLSKNGPTL